MASFFQSVSAAGLPMPASFPTPDKVKKETRELTNKLFKDREELEQIVARHEDTIRKRWVNKSNSQKKKILLEAWPNMAKHHRPDVAAWMAKSQSKEPYMWPLINLEDLATTRNLLILLHYRGRHQPHEFVHSDLEQAALGEASGTCMPDFLNEYTMLFHGRTTPKAYGALVSWDDDDNAFENLTNGIGMHPGHGIQALEIQQRIWEFLVKICRLLLQDISSRTTGPILPNPGEPVSLHPEITSLRVISMEAPYKVPAQIDFLRLRALLSAERNAREDHLWSLREDPSYFSEVLQDFAAHRQEMLVDTQGQQHPTLKQPGRPLFWNRVLGNIVVESYFGFVTFEEIVKQVDKVAQLHNAHHHKIKPENDLPRDLFTAFQSLRFVLDSVKTDLILNLKTGLFASPPLQQFCVREPQDSRTSTIRTAFRPPHQDHAIKRIMPFFDILFKDDQLHLFGLHNVTDEIERLTRSDPEVAKMITPWISTHMSSLSVVSECLHQLHLFQPWARKIEDDMDMNKDKMLTQYKTTFKDWLSILGVKFEGSQVYKYVDLSDGRFDYPIQRRRNKVNVETMIKAEKNLDVFWATVDNHYKKNANSKSQHDLVAHLLDSDRAIQRTAPWVEPEKTKMPSEKVEYVYQPFSPTFHDPTKQITGAFNRASLLDASSKVKTRGAAAVSVESAPTEDTSTQELVPIYTVDKRAYKVFKTLFHSPSNPDQPGEVPWMDFLHAMVSMGFAAEKLHGSAWSFVPTKFDVGVERSIQFHEPHPSNKIPFRWARQYGRRLSRAYGWSSEAFRLD